MRTKPRGLSVLAVLTAAALFLPFGDDAGAQQPLACENGVHYGDFDFWVGEWKVYTYNNPDQYQGHNSIIKTESNCLVREQWTGAGGGTGFSMNFYNPESEEWRQIWVSGGAIIDYSGGLNTNGQMVLEGIITYQASGAGFPFRGTWTARNDGSVRQLFEQYDPEAKDWKVWFDGLYVRDDSETEDNS